MIARRLRRQSHYRPNGIKKLARRPPGSPAALAYASGFQIPGRPKRDPHREGTSRRPELEYRFEPADLSEVGAPAACCRLKAGLQRSRALVLAELAQEVADD